MESSQHEAVNKGELGEYAALWLDGCLQLQGSDKGPKQLHQQEHLAV